MLNNPFFILFRIKFLSKEASNGEGKTFLLILFHKLQLSETLRLRLQSVASVHFPEKYKCFERNPLFYLH